MDWGIVWGVVGLLGTVFGAVGLWYAWRQRPRRELMYNEVLNVPLFRVTAPRSARDRLQVLFDGQPVKDARLLVIKLANTGNQPIRPDDQLSPIRFTFQDGDILWADITSTRPENLKPRFNFEPSPDGWVLELDHTLFNPSYGVEFTVVLQGFRGEVAAPQAQIVGVNEIVRYQDPRDRAPYKYLRMFGPPAAALSVFAIAVVGTLIVVSPGPSSNRSFAVLFFTAATGLLVTVTAGVMTWILNNATIYWRRPQRVQRAQDARQRHASSCR